MIFNAGVIHYWIVLRSQMKIKWEMEKLKWCDIKYLTAKKFWRIFFEINHIAIGFFISEVWVIAE